MEKTEGEPKEKLSRQGLWEKVVAQMDEKELMNDLDSVNQYLTVEIPQKIEEGVQRVMESFSGQIGEAEMQKRVIEAELAKRKGQVEK